MKKQYNPARILGRVRQEDWDVIKHAAKRSGLSFTQWALRILLKAAEKQK